MENDQIQPPRDLKLNFVLRGLGDPQTVTAETLTKFAEQIGLTAATAGRYSSLLAFQLIAYRVGYGVEPASVLEEIHRLEIETHSTSTKPATPFKVNGQLSGLWHKHFTSSHPSMVAANVLAARPEAVLKELAIQELSGGATVDALDRFVRRVVVDGYERRASNAQLTGEWLVYLPFEGKNLYLCLATHSGGDEEVLGYLRSACVTEFPFLRSALPKVFSSATLQQES